MFLLKVFCVFLFGVVCDHLSNGLFSRKELKKMSIYYDLKTNKTIEVMPGATELRLPFIGTPCSCSGFNCGCCAGMNIQLFNFNQKACTNITYDPYDFSVTMDVNMNENNVFTNRVSGRNPPPLCVPVPVPYLPASFCVKLFNIFTPGSNLHMCMDFETKISRFPVMILHFDCMRLGQDGIAILKPEDNGGQVGGTDTISIEPATESPTLIPEEEVPQEDGDVYDEITEIKANNFSVNVPVI